MEKDPRTIQSIPNPRMSKGDKSNNEDVEERGAIPSCELEYRLLVGIDLVIGNVARCINCKFEILIDAHCYLVG
jgi:hypothetical protein